MRKFPLADYNLARPSAQLVISQYLVLISDPPSSTDHHTATGITFPCPQLLSKTHC